MYEFYPRQLVRFTTKAKGDVALSLQQDHGLHVVSIVETVPDVYEVPPEYAGFSGLIGAYAGKRKRDLVGHHQWVTLENGKRYSGALLQPD